MEGERERRREGGRNEMKESVPGESGVIIDGGG
jgi:hypothetical protein